jgi:hypothetical protein
LPFALHSRVFELFVEESKRNLAPGFVLEKAAIAADTDAAQRDALAKHLTIGSKFSVAIESTAEFDTYIRELAAGTIWPDE